MCLFILNKNVLEELNSETDALIPGLDLALGRFITGIAMHVAITSEMSMGMNKMKFAINHRWKFSRWRYAYMAGLAQVIVTVLVALISYAVIVFSPTIIEMVKDFLALQVIRELDDFFFEEYVTSREVCKQVMLKERHHGIFKVETTTSNRARTHDTFVHDPATTWIN